MHDRIRAKLYSSMRSVAFLIWVAVWAVIPDIDHLVEGAARVYHGPILVALCVIIIGWCFGGFFLAFLSGRICSGDVI